MRAKTLEDLSPYEFPVIGTHYEETVPVGIFNGHMKQVIQNHSDTLDGLRSRGGLSYEEIYCILTDQNYCNLCKIIDTGRCRDEVLKAVKAYYKESGKPDACVNGMTLPQVLNKVLSPDLVKTYSISGLCEFLIENKLFKTENDIKLLIIEGIQKAYRDDDEFPIHFYDKDEPMSEAGKKTHVEVMTDAVVEQLKGQRNGV